MEIDCLTQKNALSISAMRSSGDSITRLVIDQQWIFKEHFFLKKKLYINSGFGIRGLSMSTTVLCKRDRAR